MPESAPKLTAQSHLHFVTGRLAERAVREQIVELESKVPAKFSLGVMPITVAALMTPRWLTRHLDVPEDATHVILPGYCQHDIETLREFLSQQNRNVEIICGPNDCRDLSDWLTGKSTPVDLSKYSIEIIAEINHAPRMTVSEVVRIANHWRAEGADRIDLGADPTGRCLKVGDYVSALVDAGHLVSIDTFDVDEARDAVQAGATLWLSAQSSNRTAAVDMGCEIVTVPDRLDELDHWDETIQYLLDRKCSIRLDPILEPIGAGLMNSLMRYHETRKRYPHLPMMMGIGNLTELTDVDSAGVNLLLLGICEELAVTSVLTTQVISWAQTSIRECDVARRLANYSVSNRVPPKRLSTDLVQLRDPKIRQHSPEMIATLAESIRDNNYRLLIADSQIHLIAADVHLVARDPFLLMAELLALPQSRNVDVSHAFYLGYEMSKAVIAITLGKQYEQDQTLQWGHLTQIEKRHRIPRKRPPKPGP